MKMKRFLSLLMAICMVISFLPANVFASEAEVSEESAVPVTPAPAAGALTVASADDSIAVASSADAYPTLVLGEAATAEITESGSYVYFSFIPETSGYYTFSSTNSNTDAYGYLYDSEWTQLTYDDDGASGNNFLIEYYLEANTVYYLGARCCSSNTGSYDVQVTAIETADVVADESASVTVGVNSKAYLHIRVDADGYYVLRLSRTEDSSSFSGSYGLYGTYIDEEAGFIYYRLWLYADDALEMALYNEEEEAIDVDTLLKAAEKPESISIVGSATVFSYSTTPSYTIDYGSEWAFTPVDWSIDDNGYIYNSGYYRANFYVYDEGTVTLTATSREDETLTASREISVVDTIGLVVGEDNNVTLPFSSQVRYTFTVDTSGLYSITFGAGNYNINRDLYLVDAEGNESSMSSTNYCYALEAGATYKLYVYNYNDDMVTTVRIAEVDQLVKNGDAYTTTAYQSMYALYVQESGWYNIELTNWTNGNFYVYEVLEDGSFSRFYPSTHTYWDDNDTYHYLAYKWLEAGSRILINLYNYNESEITIGVTDCETPESFDCVVNQVVTIVGEEAGCYLQFNPYYARSNYTVDIVSGEAEVVNQNGIWFYVTSDVAGEVVVKVTLDCGLEDTVTLKFVEPTNVVLGETATYETPAGEAAYFDLCMETYDYYIVRVNSAECEYNFSGSYGSYGSYVDEENGYTYYRVQMGNNDSILLTLYNNTEEDYTYEVLVKAAETPQNLTILGQDFGFSETDTGKYTIDYGSVWAFTPVTWTYEGNGYFNDRSDYYAYFYLQEVGALTITATSTEDETLTANFTVNIVDSIELTVGEEMEITLPYYQWHKYSFTPETSGAYNITFGDNLTNYNAYLYLLDADGNTTRVYSNNGHYLLEAGCTYRLHVRNYNGELTTTVIVEPFQAEELVLGQTTVANVPSEGYAWFSFVPEESGYYYFTSNTDADTYGRLYNAQLNQLTYNDDGGNGLNFVVRYYLEAGVQYFYAARYLDSSNSGGFDVVLNLCDKPTGMYLNYGNTTLLVGETFYVSPYFQPSSSGDSFTVTSSDENVLKFSYTSGEWHYFEALSAGTVTITVETAGGLRRELTVKVVVPMEVPLDSAVSYTAAPGEYAYFGMNVEETGYYVLRTNVVNFWDSFSGSYNYYGFRVDKDNGYTYYYLRLFEGNSAMLYLRNETEEDVTFEALLKPAETPESITIEGPEIGFSNTGSADYVVDFGNVWAFADVEWTCEGNGYLNNWSPYSAGFRLNDAGELTITATVTADPTLTDSFTITIVDSIPLTIGESAEVTLPNSNQQRYSFTVESDGLYIIRLDSELTNYDLRLQLVDADGNTSTVYQSNGAYALQAGCNYRLLLTNYQDTMTTTILVDVIPALVVGGDWLTTDMYTTAYSLTVEENGWYAVNVDATCRIYIYQSDGEGNYYSIGENYSYTDLNGNYVYGSFAWLEAGVQYLVYVRNNYGAEQLTIRAERCVTPTGMNAYSDGNGIYMTGTEVYCYIDMSPYYARDNYTVEILSGTATLVEQRGRYFSLSSDEEGTVEVKVTLDCGLEDTFTMEFVEPVDLTLNQSATTTVSGQRHGFLAHTASESGYYVFGYNSLEMDCNYRGDYNYYGHFMDEETGYTYCYLYLYEGSSVYLELSPYIDQEYEVECLMKQAEVPESLTIVGNATGFEGTYTSYYRVDFGSPWAFTPVYWESEGNGYIDSEWDYKAIFYLSQAGTLTVSATAREIEGLSTSFVINIIEALPLTVDQETALVVEPNATVVYQFTPAQSGFYFVAFGDSNSLDWNIYEAETGNRVYSNNGYWLEDGVAYKLKVRNYSESNKETVITVKSATRFVLNSTASLDIEESQMFSFTPTENGWYMLESDGYLNGSKFYTQDGYVDYQSTRIDGKRYYMANLEAGTTYYFYINYYTGNLTMKKCPTPERIEVYAEYDCYQIAGDYGYLYAEFYPANARSEITWSVSDSSILQLDCGEGYVDRYLDYIGQKPGIATITATTASGVSGSIDIKVLQPVQYHMNVGTTQTITVYPEMAIELYLYGDGEAVLSHEDYLYRPYWGSHATCYEDGMMYSYYELEEDEPRVHTLINTSDETITIHVRLQEPPEITQVTLSETEITVKPFEVFSLYYDFAPAGTHDWYLDSEIEDTDVVQYYGWWEGGIGFMGLIPGETTITFTTSNGQTATCKVTVTDPEFDATLTLDRPVTHRMQDWTDVGVFSFTASAAGNYFFAANSVLDTVLAIYDSQWELIVIEDDYSNYNPGAWVTLEANQTVYVLVKGYGVFYDGYCGPAPINVVVSTTEDVYHTSAWCYLDGIGWAYLNSQGNPVTGWQKLDNVWYYFNADGSMHFGWLVKNGTTYFMRPYNQGYDPGAMAVGLTWVYTNGIEGYYYFNENGAMQTGWQTIDGVEHLFGEDGAAVTGWYQTSEGWIYLDEEGSRVYGFIEVNGKVYYLNDQGIMVTGWQTINGRKYWFANSGAANTGWHQSSSGWYYINYNGRMATGVEYINGKWYGFKDNGIMVTGWQKIYGNWYYFNANGTAKNGWFYNNGKYYYFGLSGVMRTGLQHIDGKMYYFNDSGAMQTGTQVINGVTHYFESNGAAKTGWFKENDKWYFLKMDGSRAIGWVQDGRDWYYMDSNGYMQTGWIKQGDNWCYLAGAMATGWTEISGKRYYFNELGVMQSGWVEVDDNWYYLNNTINTGWLQIGGKWYYFDTDGAMQTGWIKLSGNWYYLDNAMATGWKQIEGEWYYFNGNGTLKTGWFKQGNDWYYLGNAMATGWTEISGQWYYFNEKGIMQSGWLKLNGSWYYLDNTMATGWKQIDGQWYYFSASGVMQSGWVKVGDNWYYLDNTMATGWKQIDGKWYYFSSTGVMQTGWVQIGGKWYYLDNTMATGWKQISGQWYYFSASGVMQTGWLQLGDTWYYLKANGAMATGTLVINGKTYYFADNGAWIP